MLRLCVLAAVFCVAYAGTRVEVELRSLQNRKGQLSTGDKCDYSGACDHKLRGYLDLEHPMNAWPGVGRPVSDWTPIFESDNDDSPRINKIISKDVCGSSPKPRKANLRVQAMDKDVGSSDDLVEQFECLTGALVSSRSESGSMWSEEQECTAKFHPRDKHLKFRYRAFEVPASECGKSPRRRT